MAEVCKKVGLSFALILAFGTSANAACDSIFCINGNVGVGGVYNNFGGNSTANGNLKSVYGAIDINLLFVKRLKLGIGIKAGAGSMRVSGSSLSNMPSRTMGAFGNISFRSGINMLSLESPLYINFIFNSSTNASKLSLIQSISVFGIELEGKKLLDEKAKLLYSIGSGAAVGLYDFDGYPINFTLPITDRHGYSIFGSLGLEYALNNYLGFYAKGIANFYDIPASNLVQLNNQTISFPAARAWNAMVEVGLTF